MAADRLQLRHDGAWVHPGAELGSGVTLAPGAVVHDGVRLGAGTAIGTAAVIHAGTDVGTDCLVEDGAVLGKRPRLRPGSSAAGELGSLSVADGVTICAGAIVYAGAQIGPGAIIGDHAQVRERAAVGARTVVGRGSTVDFDAQVGERVSIQTGGLRDRRLGGRGSRLPRSRRHHHQRPHHGPPRARRAARGSDLPARLPGRRWRDPHPRGGDRRGGVRGRGCRRHA